MRLRRQFGPGRWRKLKGAARVRLVDGTVRLAEAHWYEAHGIGRARLRKTSSLVSDLSTNPSSSSFAVDEVRLFTEMFYLVGWRLIEIFNSRTAQCIPKLPN